MYRHFYQGSVLFMCDLPMIKNITSQLRIKLEYLYALWNVLH